MASSILPSHYLTSWSPLQPPRVREGGGEEGGRGGGREGEGKGGKVGGREGRCNINPRQ